MARLRLEFHPQAVREAAAARNWYAERSPRIADEFTLQLEQAFDQIAETPRRFPVYRHGTRRCLLRRIPYLVVYREQL